MCVMVMVALLGSTGPVEGSEGVLLRHSKWKRAGPIV